MEKAQKFFLAFVFIFFIFFCNFQIAKKEAKAEEQPQAKLFLSPDSGSFLVDSIFDVSIILDTDDATINAVRAELEFPADKLQIVNPASGKSFISVWLDQPTYSNKEGIIRFSGGVPEGIRTSSGVVSTITFRVIKAGEAVIKILPSSSVLAHDGKGTEILHKLIEGRYVLKPIPPKGPRVFSETHPDETRWYNNNNSILSWDKEENVTDFSYLLDGYPQSVPDNTSQGQETTKAFEDLPDGLWYFHIKAKKEGVWGAPSHFLLRIDTIPPASFKPKVEFLLAAIIGRALVSFSTIDALSGIDHYGVAVIDRTEPPVESPVFIETQSPYQLPPFVSGNLRVIVRAQDKAGNVRDEHIDINFPESIFSKIRSNILVSVLSMALIVVFGYLAVHFKHKIFQLPLYLYSYLKRFINYLIRLIRK